MQNPMIDKHGPLDTHGAGDVHCCICSFCERVEGWRPWSAPKWVCVLRPEGMEHRGDMLACARYTDDMIPETAVGVNQP